MASNKTYQFSIQGQAGEWYAMDGNDVKTQTTPFYYGGDSNFGAVANWETLGLRDSRNMRMGGFFRNRSSEVQFVKSLAKIMRHAMYKKGENYKLTLHIDRWNSTTYTYDPDGSSEISLAQSRDEKNQFAAYMAEAGVPELIKTREDTPYSLAVIGSDVVSVKVLPTKVKGRSKFTSIKAPGQSGHGANRVAEKYNWAGYAYFDEIVIEVLDSPNFRPVDYFAPLSAGLSTAMEFGQFYNELPSLGNSEGYILKSNVRLEIVKLKFTLPVYINNLDASPVTFRGKIYQADATGAANWVSRGSSTTDITVTAGNSTSQSFTFDLEIDLEANKVLHIIMENLTPAVTNVEWQYEAERPLTIDFEHYSTEYTTTGYNAYTLLSKLIDRITGGAVTFDSTLLSNAITYLQGSDCRPDKLLITSTQCLQGKASPVITISLKDLLTSLSVWLGCGLTILRDLVTMDYSQVRVEDWNYFYKRLRPDTTQNIIADFDSVSDFYIEPAEEMIFSQLRAGYDPADIDEVNVSDDVHAANVYTSAHTASKNTMELISPITASGLALLKEHLAGTTNKSSATNQTNKNFVIQYNPVQVAGVHTALYSTDINATPFQTGITDPTRLLNPGLTPAHIVIRNAYYILSHMPYTEDFITDNYKLTFQSTDRNSSYVSKLATIFVIAQSVDIDIADYVTYLGQNRLFYPKYLYHTAPSKRNYKLAWEANRFGVFNVTIPLQPYNNPIMEVFPVESADWTAKNDTYDFKSLLTAGNDLGDLVR